jgi:hypothetical protein
MGGGGVCAPSSCARVILGLILVEVWKGKVADEVFISRVKAAQKIEVKPRPRKREGRHQAVVIKVAAKAIVRNLVGPCVKSQSSQEYTINTSAFIQPSSEQLISEHERMEHSTSIKNNGLLT